VPADRPCNNKIGRLHIWGWGTRLAGHSGVEFVVPALIALIAFVLGQFVVAWLSTTLKRTRIWGLPALLFCALSIVAFAEAAAVPPPESGGPPILDFGPLPYYMVGFTAAVATVVALAAGARARKVYLDRRHTAPPELAVAIVHDR
jgi:hypothetical protein